MPQRQNLDNVCSNSIEKVVTDASKVESPYSSDACTWHAQADPRFRAEQREGLRQILVEGIGRAVAIVVPPARRAINLGLRAPGDANLHMRSAVTAGELREDLVGRNRVPTIGLGNRQQQLAFLLARELEAAIVVIRKDRDG